MPDQTPELAIPYALDSDSRALWPATSQDMAERVEALVAAEYMSARGSVGVSTALVDNAWTDAALSTWSHTDVFTVDAAGTTYTGAAPALFLITYTVGVYGVTTNARLLVNGAAMPQANRNSSTAQFGTLSRTDLHLLSPGDRVALSVMAGTGGGSPTYSESHLAAVRV